MTQNDVLFYMQALRSRQCQCDRPKKSGMALCFRCYRMLPRDMQRDLWQPINKGFQKAYDAAVAEINLR